MLGFFREEFCIAASYGVFNCLREGAHAKLRDLEEAWDVRWEVSSVGKDFREGSCEQDLREPPNSKILKKSSNFKCSVIPRQSPLKTFSNAKDSLSLFHAIYHINFPPFEL